MMNKIPLISKKISVNKHILLVENDKIFAQQLAEQIQTFGYQVSILLMTDDLYQHLQAQKPCAIIIDLNLSSGALSGTKAIHTLRQKNEKNALQIPPVIFISSHDEINTRLEAIKAGGDAYLLKPLDVGHLIEWMDKLISRQTEEACEVLIVDNDIQSAQQHATILEKADILTSICLNPLKILTYMENKNPDLILMNLYLSSDCLGSDLASMIRQIDAYMAIPIVYLSPELSNQLKIQALLKGGDNFLFLPVPDETLVLMVKYKAQRFRRLRALMLKDGLTGLYNHRHIKEFIKNECARAQRHGSEVSLAMFDIDYFKQVNDRYGHAVGDSVLKTLARFLKDRVRKTDLVGRYGGEEFVIIFPNTSIKIATMLCETLRIDFEKILHFTEKDTFKITFSCGVAAYPRYNHPQLLADYADQALYLSKNKGRNQVSVL